MQARTEQLQIRVTPSQKAALRSLATRAELSVSAFVLSRALPEGSGRFGELLRQLRAAEDRRFVLAELNALLTGLAPGELADAVADTDLRGLTPFDQNYVAALVEQAATRADVPPPSWVRTVPPLTEPWFATTLASLRAHLLHASPVPFKRRNLFVDAGLGARV